MNCTICVAKRKALISFAVTAKLICVFVFAYAKRWFSHDAAHFQMSTFSDTNKKLADNEPRHEKTGFLHMQKQRRRSASHTVKLISAFVFATLIVQSLYFLHPKCQASVAFCGRTARLMSDLVRSPKTSFVVTRLI